MKENEVLSLLEIRKTICGKRDAVFDALTKPEIMSEWFYGMDQGSAKFESDFRVGESMSSECSKATDPHRVGRSMNPMVNF